MHRGNRGTGAQNYKYILYIYIITKYYIYIIIIIIQVAQIISSF